MRKRVPVLLLAALLVLGVVPISAAAAPAYTAGEEFMVASAYEGQILPDIDYPWIVWKDGRVCPCTIYAYNFVTGETRQISDPTEEADATNPSVSGDWAVWHQELDYGSSIWAYNFTTKERIKIADGEADGDCYGNPAIDGTIAVFRFDGDGGIYAVDLADADPEAGMWQVSPDDGDTRYGPEIGDGWVVARVYDGSGYRIEAYQIESDAVVDTVVVARDVDTGDGVYWDYDGPSTDAGMLTYNQYGQWDWDDDGSPEPGDAIMLYDLAADTLVTQMSAVAANNSSREHPVINDGLVSWHDKRSGYMEVYIYTLATATESCLVDSDADAYAGRTTTADGIVAWHDHRSGDADDSYSDIYAEFVFSTPPASSGDAYGVVTGNALSVAAPGVLANDTDPEDDPLSAELVTDVTNGVLSLNADGSFTYTPDAAFVGTDSFTYVANDGLYSSGPTTVTIVVIASGDYAEGSVVYRFYNPATGAHFFTSSVEERNNVLAQYPGIWYYEGVAFLSTPAAGTTPLHRFYNSSTRAHFYTASDGEKANVLATWPTLFTYEGTTFNVSETPGPGKAPVYRFYNVESRSHFYTTSAWERDHIIATWPKVFRYEGIGYYVVAP